MASSFWKIVGIILVVVVVGAALTLVTALNPQVRELAAHMAGVSHLPIWLVGLAAPIVFVFKKLFGAGPTGNLGAVESDNEKLKVEQAQLRKEVSDFNNWRDQELSKLRVEMARLQGDLDSLRLKIAGVNGQISSLRGATLDGIGKTMTEEEKLASGREFFEKDLELGIIE